MRYFRTTEITNSELEVLEDLRDKMYETRALLEGNAVLLEKINSEEYLTAINSLYFNILKYIELSVINYEINSTPNTLTKKQKTKTKTNTKTNTDLITDILIDSIDG